MDCKDVSSSMASFLHGELPPGLMRGIQVHLGGCITCRKSLLQERQTHDVIIPLYHVAMLHGELTDQEMTLVRSHLAYCEPCREQLDRLRDAANELTKNLSQYQLSRTFRVRVMQQWKPHRMGKRSRYNQRGLADMIERAEAGNTFSYERHVDRFKDYAYIAAYQEVKDFHWASEIARDLFVRGMPVFRGELSQADFLVWLHQRVGHLAQKEGWLGQGEAIGSTGRGLSGYAGSRKLRRHRLLLEFHASLPEEQQMPFLLCYVQRLSYAEIAALLGMDRMSVLTGIAEATREAADKLTADDQTDRPLLQTAEA